MVKCLPTMRETQVQSLGQEDLLEKEIATHSSILAWKIPWMEEPGRLQSMGSQRVGHDWVTSLHFIFSVKYNTSQPYLGYKKRKIDEEKNRNSHPDVYQTLVLFFTKVGFVFRQVWYLQFSLGDKMLYYKQISNETKLPFIYIIDIYPWELYLKKRPAILYTHLFIALLSFTLSPAYHSTIIVFYGYDVFNTI